MSQERITTLLTEKRSYPPPEHGKSSAWICGQDEADAICRRALEDPNDFWGARASQLIHWFKRWDKVLEADEARHKYRWFTGAKLNAAFNCIDRTSSPAAATRPPSSGRAKRKWTCAASPTRCSIPRSAVWPTP